jgi:hypothetical protein
MRLVGKTSYTEGWDSLEFIPVTQNALRPLKWSKGAVQRIFFYVWLDSTYPSITTSFRYYFDGVAKIYTQKYITLTPPPTVSALF